MKQLDYNDFLNEGLIRTYPISIYNKNLLDNLLFLNLNIEIDINHSNETFKLIISDDVIFNDLIIINSYTNNLGYFLTKFKVEKNNKSNIFKYDSKTFESTITNNNGLTLYYESKFDDQIKITNKLYHTTEIKNIEKIIKNGLYPKSNSKIEYHSERIYLSKDKNDCIKLIPRLRALSLNINIPFVIFEINKPNMYYMDAKSNGVYTFHNINKQNLKCLNELYTVNDIIKFDDIKFDTKTIDFLHNEKSVYVLDKKSLYTKINENNYVLDEEFNSALDELFDSKINSKPTKKRF